MLVFVNNIPVHIVDRTQDLVYTDRISLKDPKQKFDDLGANPLIENASPKHIIQFLEYLHTLEHPSYESVTFLIKNESDMKSQIKSSMHLVKAAGGVVENHEGKVLMMKRLGVWDLPKGKAEKKEKSEVTAVREVEEECNVKVFSNEKVATTWHTYYYKKVFTLKRTKWYSMGLISDSKMKPQTEEGIEELKWLDVKELTENANSSYKSIKYVVDQWKIFKNIVTE